MASSLKNKFEDLAKPEEKQVVKAKKIQKVEERGNMDLSCLLHSPLALILWVVALGWGWGQ